MAYCINSHWCRLVTDLVPRSAPFKLAAMVSQIIYGMRSPPARTDTLKKIMVLASIAAQSTKIRIIPPKSDLLPKKVTEHKTFIG